MAKQIRQTFNLSEALMRRWITYFR